MRFTVERMRMLAICKNLARLTPDSGPIEDLTGILIVADENSGRLRLVATNMDVTLEYSTPAIIQEGGRMVLKGRLLAGMMHLFNEDRVSFSTFPSGSAVRIESGTARYDVSYLPGKHFPESNVAAPDNVVKLSGLANLVKQTVFAASKNAGASGNILMNAKLEVYPTEAHMTCTDSAMLAVARQVQVNSGRMTLLIPVKSLPLLISVCGNEAVEAGMSGTTLVFSGNGFILATRTMQGVYPDTSSLLSRVIPMYDAIVDAGAFRNDISCAGTVYRPGMYVRLALRESGIELFYESSLGQFKTTTDAAVLNDMPGEGFHYNANHLDQSLRHMTGNLQIGIDRTGNMLIKGQNLCYFLTPRRQSKPIAAPEQEKNPKPKKAAKTDKTDAAA